MVNVLKFFLPKHSIKRKILDIVGDIKMEVKTYSEEKFWIDWYGAYEIDPKNLAIWICVKTDKVKKNLELNDELKAKINKLFIKHDYPVRAMSSIKIGFESQETVDRESCGNWYQHFK